MLADDILTTEDIRQRAAQIGMTSLSDSQVAELLAATNVARTKRNALAVASLVPTDEPAHVFVLDGE